MNILQVNKLYYPHIGGIETVIQDISEGLKTRADISVLVCQEKGKTKKEIINGVKVTRASSFGIFSSMPVSFSFINLFKKMSKKADIIHLHLPFPLSDLACLLSGYKGKVVVSWHSDIVKQKKLLKLYKPIMNALLKRADCIIVATQGHIDGSQYLKPYANKCRIIPYGINTKLYTKNTKKILTNKLFDKEDKKVLFIGRLVYYKGIEVLLEAFSHTYGSELFIVGKGPLEKELLDLSMSLGIHDKVHFMGKLSDVELMEALEDCDIFVLPSVENSEAFGIVQMEAMAYGKPIINTCLNTGVPYVSINGETGITVEPRNANQLSKAIKELVENDEKRKEYGERAYELVRQKFEMKKVLNDLFELYKDLTEK